ncbi:MAG: SUMF1/EgtB/PvdO family nonheme iron enzyme [Acidobacteriota bacterium]
MTQGRLSPRQRAAAGDTLARLGDPRPAVTSLEGIEYCLVPAGPFWMGSGDALHLNESLDSDYWISRFPVTNAHYAAFVEAGGYQEARYWQEAEAQGWWRKGQFKGRFDSEPRSGPYDLGEPYGLANRPVVGVSWYEALAFTCWLTDFLAPKNLLPAGCKVRLPSEAQWEKAARGGLQVPAEPVMGSLLAKRAPRLKKNASPQRRYPWGEECRPQHANYNESGISGTSAVGAFPQGASPYGCLEMSGNAWEWTSSQHRNFPYRSDDGREDPAAAKAVRVVRGGAFYWGSESLGCSSRSRSNLSNWIGNFGFRLALSP